MGTESGPLPWEICCFHCWDLTWRHVGPDKPTPEATEALFSKPRGKAAPVPGCLLRQAGLPGCPLLRKAREGEAELTDEGPAVLHACLTPLSPSNFFFLKLQIMFTRLCAIQKQNTSMEKLKSPLRLPSRGNHCRHLGICISERTLPSLSLSLCPRVHACVYLFK